MIEYHNIISSTPLKSQPTTNSSSLSQSSVNRQSLTSNESHSLQPTINNSNQLEHSTQSRHSNSAPKVSIKHDSKIVESFHQKLEKIHRDLQIKPNHWTDEYWENIIRLFPWFLYRDGQAGCKICLHQTGYCGKKSLLSIMKQLIMDLSYEQFENKLHHHDNCSQHLWATQKLLARFNLIDPPKSGKNTEKSSSRIDFRCPQCRKQYKFKKALITHIGSCSKPTDFVSAFGLPCQCDLNSLVGSLESIDRHLESAHLNRFAFQCKFCEYKSPQLTVLFEHVLLNHDFLWNPRTEFPKTIDNGSPDGIRPIQTREIDLDCSEIDENCVNRSRSSQLKRKNSKRVLFKEVSQSKTDNSITSVTDENRLVGKNRYESTNHNCFSLPISAIVTCRICDGRYLTKQILDEHIRRYHNRQLEGFVPMINTD